MRDGNGYFRLKWCAVHFCSGKSVSCEEKREEEEKRGMRVELNER